MKKLFVLLLVAVLLVACVPRTQVTMPNPNRLEVDTVMQRRVIRTN